jgi:hypothetical protein
MTRKPTRLFTSLLAAVILSLIRFQTAAAQVPKGCQDTMSHWVDQGVPGLDVQLNNFVNLPEQVPCLWQLLDKDGTLAEDRHNATVRAIVQKAFETQKSVNTTQAGSATGSGGTTSAVSKPTTPTSASTEFGGITSSTNSQTLTLQSPLDGIPRALASHGLIPYCSTPVMAVTLDGKCASNGLLRKLDRIGLGVSLNTSATSKSASGTATGTGQGTTQQVSLSSLGTKTPSLAGVFVKYALRRATAKVTKLPDPTQIVAKPQDARTAAITADLKKFAGYADWQSCVRIKMNAAPADQRAVVFAQYYARIVDVLFRDMDPGTDCSKLTPLANEPETIDPKSLSGTKRDLLNDLEAWIAAADIVQAEFDRVLTETAAAPLVSIEYDYNTPQNQPTNSTFKLVASFGWGKAVAPAGASAKGSSPAPTKPWTFTGNAGFSIYNYTPASTIPNASLLRDVQVGTEVDRSIASSKWPSILGKIGDSTASATYYFQYQSSPSILNVTPGSPLSGITITGLPSTATQVFAQKGDIHVAQLKWGLGKGNNVKFPIAVTYSNRTELITHPAWGLQFGVSYDLSALMGTGSSK